MPPLLIYSNRMDQIHCRSGRNPATRGEERHQRDGGYRGNLLPAGWEPRAEAPELDLALAFERYKQAVLISGYPVARQRILSVRAADRLAVALLDLEDDIASHRRRLLQTVCEFAPLLSKYSNDGQSSTSATNRRPLCSCPSVCPEGHSLAKSCAVMA